MIGAAVEAHQINGHVVFLRGEAGKRQRLFRIAMIAGGINAVRHIVADHSVLHSLLIALAKVLEDHLPHSLNRRPAVRGQLGRDTRRRYGLC